MYLQTALLILGAVLILIIFGTSRYSDAIDQFRKRREANRTLKARTIDSQPVRRANNAPKLNDSNGDAHEAGESPLFSEFNRAKIVDRDDELGNVNKTGDTDAMDDSEQDDRLRPTDNKAKNQVINDTEDVIEDISSIKEETAEIGPFTSLRQIDFWIKLSPALPYTQTQIIDKLGDINKVDFPVQIHGLTQEQSQWANIKDVSRETKLLDLVASYQLIHKGKAALITDIQAFDERVTSLGKVIGAEKLMMATPRQALEQSQKLAEFYLTHCDPIQVSVNAPDGQSFMGKLVETSAKQQGLEYLNGEYVRIKRMNTKSVVLYRMVSEDPKGFDENMSKDTRISHIYFQMTPTLSSTPGRDISEMLDAVKAFASRVKGQIRVADNGDFEQDQMLNLCNYVSNLEGEMIDCGLEPGGTEIKRVFS